MLNYRLPTLDDYNILYEYVAEHYSNGERSISASIDLTKMKFEEWVKKINQDTIIPDEKWGKHYLYLAFDNERLIGLLSIRFDMPNNLQELYGNIGYGVRPSERRKGYATEMLKYALNVCKEKNMEEVILGCYDYNIASNKTIKNNGGILYRTDIQNKQLSDEWEIQLKDNFYKIKLNGDI